MKKNKISLKHFIGTILMAALAVCLNHGCGKPQEPEAPSPTSETHSSAQPELTPQQYAAERAAKAPVSGDTSADEHFYLGIESAKTGNLDEAIKAWEKAVEKDPKFIKAHNYLARSYYTKERFDEALSEYQKIVELDPTDATAQVSIGFVYKIKGKYDEAIDACAKAIQIEPQLASAFNCIGASFVQKKMYTEAIEAYNMAVRIDPEYADAFFGLGIAYESAGMAEEAKQAFAAFDEIKDKTSGAAPAPHAH